MNTTPLVLDQGRTLYTNRAKRATALSSNLQLINGGNFANMQEQYKVDQQFNPVSRDASMEGFTTAQAQQGQGQAQQAQGQVQGQAQQAQGQAQQAQDQHEAIQKDLHVASALSAEYNMNINRYARDNAAMINDSRTFSTMHNRQAQAQAQGQAQGPDQDPAPQSFKARVDQLYDITAHKAGCYKKSANTQLVYQSDLKEVTVDTCKMRAADLGYSSFALRKDATGQPACYVGKNLDAEKTGGVATKSVTSYAFKTSPLANMGSLLMNGQLGIYTDNISSNMVTDLTGVPGCDFIGSKILINDASVVATYGANCTLNAYLLGVGTNNFLYTRKTLKDPWVQVPNSGLVTSAITLKDGSIVGVGLDYLLYTRKTLTDPWVQVPNSGDVKSIFSLGNGSFLGVGTDYLLFTKSSITAPWVEIPNSGNVIAAIALKDGTVLGVGLDNLLYTSVNTPWIQVANSGFVKSITALKDGTIVGVGLDNLIYTKSTLTAPWAQIPNSGDVIAISAYNL